MPTICNPTEVKIEVRQSGGIVPIGNNNYSKLYLTIRSFFQSKMKYCDFETFKEKESLLREDMEHEPLTRCP